MTIPGEANPPRLSTEDAFLDLLTETLESVESGARGQFLQRFFKSIANVELTEKQSIEVWDQTQLRRRDLVETLGRNVLWQVALIDVLASADLVRLPILMEYEQLRKLQISAATDPLTGLYNRRFFDEFFDREINRSSRYSHRLALVVFDLHQFKDVNDRYGHAQGDVLLQIAANTLRRSMRTSDYAFRIGGDEFALLLPQSDTEQAAALSRRLRVAYATATDFLHLGVPLALDYGLAVYPDDGEQKEFLFRIADERLYSMKNSQRPGSPSPRAAKVQASPFESARAPDKPAPAPSASERRRWERVSLANTQAYALIGENAESKAKVIDLGYGGVALLMSAEQNYQGSFPAVLHVPILPPVRVTLRPVFRVKTADGTLLIGCTFVT